ncbi:MAG TPA: hypothetical protein VMT88_08875, partial [Actinomycetes bacterium]|nr:hypothetical protein [Actinomycetes bacterium]
MNRVLISVGASVALSAAALAGAATGVVAAEQETTTVKAADSTGDRPGHPYASLTQKDGDKAGCDLLVTPPTALDPGFDQRSYVRCHHSWTSI